MKTINVEIKNIAGLHARPSSLFVQIASKYDSKIMVICDEEEINGKSIMGLMLLAAEQGRVITITADGEDEDEALKDLQKLVEIDTFNEE